MPAEAQARVWKTPHVLMDKATLPNRRLRLNYPAADPQWWCVDEDPLGLEQPWKGRAELSISGIPWGRLGEAAPQPRCTGCCPRQKHRGSRMLQPGGVSCWPLITGAEFTHLKLIHVSLHSLCSLCNCKASTLLVPCSGAKTVAQAVSEVRSAGRCYLLP